MDHLEKIEESEQREQREESKQSEESPPSLQFVKGDCNHYFPADAYCNYPGCDGQGCVSSEQMEEEMVERRQLFKSKTQTGRADSSRDLQVCCENDQLDSSSDRHDHHETDHVYSSNIREILHKTDHVDSSNIRNVHSRQKCRMCLDECTELNDSYPSYEFCSVNCYNYSRYPFGPRPTSLPEGAYVDTCDSSSKPTVHCESRADDSSTDMWVKCGNYGWDYLRDSSGCARRQCTGEICQSLHSEFGTEGPTYGFPTIAGSILCIICREPCSGKRDSFPSNEFCSRPCYDKSR